MTNLFSGPASRRQLCSRTASGRALIVGLALCALPGCPSQPATADAAVADTGADVSVLLPPDEVDILFVLNNSPNGWEATVDVRLQVYTLLSRVFAGDFDGDGTAEGAAPRSIHVGVTTTDLGVPREDGDVYCQSERGDDGILLASAPPECAPAPAILELAPRARDLEAAFAEVSCRLSVLRGCTFEQPLDAALKALSPVPSTEGASPVDWTAPGWTPPRFRGDTVGHGERDGANAGFLRPDSVLVVVILSHEDDCSSPDRGVYDEREPGFEEHPSSRCVHYADHLYDVERYVAGLAGLRRRPDRLVFAAITGIPVRYNDSEDFDAILGAPDMAVTLDGLGQIVEVCQNSRPIHAAPARRMVETARGLHERGALVVMRSICDDDYSPAFEAIAAAVGEALSLD